MKTTLTIATILLSGASSAFASDLPMYVSEVLCATGSRNSATTVEPKTMTNASYIRMLSHRPKASMVETDSSAVLSVIVTGEIGSECENAGKETILTIILQK